MDMIGVATLAVRFMLLTASLFYQNWLVRRYFQMILQI